MSVRIKLPVRFPWQELLAQLVLRSSARFIVACVGRRAGKTAIATDIAGEVAMAGGEVFWGAPTYDISERGREEFKRLFRPACSKFTDSKPASATLLNGAQVVWRSFDRAGAALGRGTKLVIIDEAARVKKQIIQEEILPTIADTNGKILFITTPRGKRHLVYKWYQHARQGNKLYAYVHGPSTANPNPAIRAFIRDCRGEMPDHLFNQEILAAFLEGEGMVFRNVAQCATLSAFRDRPDNGDDYIIGCDVAKHQDYTVLYAMHAETGEVHGYDRFNHLDWPTIEARIVEFYERWNEGELWLDSTGVGDPVFDHLLLSGVDVVGTKFTNESKSNLVRALSASLDQRSIAYPPDDGLEAELEAFEYEILPSGKFRYSAPDGEHDDRAVALALAAYGRNKATTGVPI